MFELLTLLPPFEAETEAQLARLVETRMPPAARSRNASVPADLDAVCAMALGKEPHHRYATAGEFADDLERFVASKPVVARPVRPLTRAYRWTRRHPMPTLALALALLCALALIAVQQLATAASTTTAALASNQLARARLHVAEGSFDEALADAAAARASGFEDEAALLLTEFEAHEGRGDYGQASAALARIQSAPRDPSLAARWLLLRGDYAVDRVADAREGLDLIRRALASENLTPADAAYARCVLADDLTTALREVEQALDLAPFHRRAKMMAVWLAVGGGDRKAAISHLRRFERQFPRDPVVSLLQRALRLLDESPMESPTGVESDASASRTWQHAALLLDGIELARAAAEQVAEQQQSQLRGDSLLGRLFSATRSMRTLIERGRAIAAGARRIGAMPRSPQSGGVAIHPVIVTAWRPLVLDAPADLIEALRSKRRSDVMIDTLRRCSAKVDDGFFHLLLGFLHYRAQSPWQASQSFQRAIERPSSVALRRHALRIQMALDAAFSTGVVKAEHQGVPDHLAANVDRLLAYDDLDPMEWNLTFTAALENSVWDLAGYIAAAWQRASNHVDLAAMKAEMDLAARTGKFLHAKQVAEAALVLDDSLWWARQVSEGTDRVVPQILEDWRTRKQK